MSPSDLIEILEQHPAERLRVVMASGQDVIIHNPLRAVVNGLSLYIQIYGDEDSRVRPQARIVSIPNITMIEPFRGGPPNGRVPRRRRPR